MFWKTAKVKLSRLKFIRVYMARELQTDDDRIYAHLLTLLSVSAAMVGVCLTAVGLVNVIEVLQKWEGWVDDILAIGSLLFSIVTLLSFLGLRTKLRFRWPWFVLILDVCFCLGIVTMVVASFLLTYFVI